MATTNRISGPTRAIEALEQRVMLYTGDVLVGVSVDGNRDELREYTQTGTLVKAIAIPDGGGRDFQVDVSGNIQLWNGGFDPILQGHQGPVTGTGKWVQEASTLLTPGWSAIGRTFYGGIATLGQYVYATDQNTGNGAANGLIRFDSQNHYASTRFARGEDFSDCSIGMDGKLYAMNGGETFGPTVKVFDPITLKLLKTVSVPGFDNTCVTADSSGNIYLGGFFEGILWKLTPAGKVITSVPIQAKDIDISTDNQLLVGDGGTARLLDTNLKILHAFPAGSYTGANFVAFAKYQAPPTATKTGSIAGTIYNDTNGNAKKDTGEAGLAGRTVWVDLDNDKVQDSTEPKATTDASGNYKIAGVAAGAYIVRQVLPSGWSQTAPTGGNGLHITLSAGQNATGQNLGEKQASIVKTASISGTVFNDADGDGIRDAGELGLGLWKVFIDANKNGKFDSGEASSITDVNGNWSIETLAAGSYVVRIVQLAATSTTTPSGGGLNLSLAAGQKITGKLFGEKRIA